MITINLDKAKTISHDIRRQKRAEEFAPLAAEDEAGLRTLVENV